jgi:anti-sigma factor RsiW
MPSCREFIEFLMAYLSDELPPGQRAVFEEYLAECPECRTYLRTYLQTIRLGKLACGGPDQSPADVPEALIRAILAARAK